MIKLSKRLLAVAELVTPGKTVADVGTDHGYIPIYLVERGLCKKAVAMDVNAGPLLRAEEHIKESGLEQYITTRRSDGVRALKKGEADSVVIAGMGGGLVIKILTEGREILSSVEELILQPQSDVDKVRHFLFDSGYRITKENMILEDGKYYPMMHVIKSRENETYPECFFKYGGCLIREKNQVLCQYLKKEESQLLSIKERLLPEQEKEHIKVRLKEIEEELSLIKEARSEMQKDEM